MLPLNPPASRLVSTCRPIADPAPMTTTESGRNSLVGLNHPTGLSRSRPMVAGIISRHHEPANKGAGHEREVALGSGDGGVSAGRRGNRCEISASEARAATG